MGLPTRLGNTRSWSCHTGARSLSSFWRLRCASSAVTAILLRGTDLRLALFLGGPSASPSAVTLRERATESLFALRSTSNHLRPRSSPCRRQPPQQIPAACPEKPLTLSLIPPPHRIGGLP